MRNPDRRRRSTLEKIQMFGSRKHWSLVVRYLSPYWKTLLLLLAFNLILTGLTSTMPLIMAPLLDLAQGKDLALNAAQPITLANLSLSNIGDLILRALHYERMSGPFQLVLLLAGVYLGMGMLSLVLDLLAYRIGIAVGARAQRSLQRDVFAHTLSLPLRFFVGQKSGRLLSRLENDTRWVFGSMDGILGNIIIAPLTILFYGYLLVRTSYRLALAVLIAGLFHFIVTRGMQVALRRRARRRFTAGDTITATIQEVLLSIRVVKSFGMEDYEVEKISGQLDEAAEADIQTGTFQRGEKPLRDGLNRLIEVGILLLASTELLSGRLDLTTFFLYLYIGRSIMRPIATLGSTLVTLQIALTASERLIELQETRSELTEGPVEIADFHESIRVDGVSFAYEDLPTLQDIHLEVSKGEKLALVGPSGAGKSTLVDLIMRLYDPDSGQILIDQHPLPSLRLDSYRQLFGVVSQETLLFNATLRENILYGRAHLTGDDLLRAAKIANAHGFIMEMPDGYETLVGDRGTRLSGGQRQRIAIARAIAGHPRILIMDEATSALDSEAEILVQQAIEAAIHDTTAIIIAQRLSTIQNADRIAVISEGRIEAIGTHAALMSVSETYQRVYARDCVNG